MSEDCVEIGLKPCMNGGSGVYLFEARSRRVGGAFPEQAGESKGGVSLIITDLEAKKKTGLNVFWCFKPLENPINQVAEPSERF